PGRRPHPAGLPGDERRGAGGTAGVRDAGAVSRYPLAAPRLAGGRRTDQADRPAQLRSRARHGVPGQGAAEQHRAHDARVNVDAYLERIGYAGPREPGFETLAALHRAHMLSVPFENLDIHLGRRLVLDREANFEKIVVRHRGGWCYELNGLFALLLERLGFRVTLLGA